MFHNFCNSFSDDGLRRFYFFFLTKYQVFPYFLCSIKIYSLDINYFSNLIWDVNYFVESNLQWGGRRSPNTTLAPNLRKTGDGIWSKSGAFVPFESKSFTFKTYFCLLELEKTVYFLPNNIVVLLRTWVRFFLRYIWKGVAFWVISLCSKTALCHPCLERVKAFSSQRLFS